jgi:hypothetical protein
VSGPCAPSPQEADAVSNVESVVPFTGVPGVSSAAWLQTSASGGTSATATCIAKLPVAPL